jgi:hypothetical protein
MVICMIDPFVPAEMIKRTGNSAEQNRRFPNPGTSLQPAVTFTSDRELGD